MPRDDDDRDEEDTRRRDRFGDDDDEPRRPKKKKGGFPVWVIGLILGLGGCCVLGVGGLVYGMFASVGKVREAAARAKDSNNLKQIAIGAHNYNSATSTFPGPQPINPATGLPNPGLSYRVALLPYVEAGPLYQQFDHGAAWDSPRNRPLGDSMVRVYASPMADDQGTTKTRYQGFVGPGTMFDPSVPRGVRISDVIDGTSNTVYMVTSNELFVWSQPKDIPFCPTQPVPSFGEKTFPNGTMIVLVDGSVRLLKKDTPDTVKKALITRNGDEPVDLDW